MAPRRIDRRPRCCRSCGQTKPSMEFFSTIYGLRRPTCKLCCLAVLAETKEQPRRCCVCGLIKTEGDFYHTNGWLRSACKACHIIQCQPPGAAPPTKLYRLLRRLVER